MHSMCQFTPSQLGSEQEQNRLIREEIRRIQERKEIYHNGFQLSCHTTKSARREMMKDLIKLTYENRDQLSRISSLDEEEASFPEISSGQPGN